MKKVGTLKNVNLKYIDNLLNLIIETDVYDGLINFLFFEIIDIEPIDYCRKYEYGEYTEDEIKFFSEDHKRFKNYKFNKTITEEIKEVTLFIRDYCIKNNIISKNFSILNKAKYSGELIMKSIYKFYNKKKKGDM